MEAIYKQKTDQICVEYYPKQRENNLANNTLFAYNRVSMSITNLQVNR